MESPDQKVSDQLTASSGVPTDAPIETFAATRNELQQIAAFWMGVLVTHAFRLAVIGGPTDLGETKLAVQRLTLVASLLSREELAAAFKQMECKFPSKHDPEDYMGFLRGEALREGGKGAPGLGSELHPAGDYECFHPVASISQTASSERKRELSPDVVLPMGDARVSVGFVDEVCGAGGRLVPEYSPIRPELVHLVKYWVSEIAEVEYFEFCSQQFGSCDRRLKTFGRRRIERLGTMLTDIEMYWAIDQAETEFRDGIPPKCWELFKSGEMPQRRYSDGFPRWPPEPA